MASNETAVPRGPLPHTIVPSHCALALRIDPRADGFSGEVRIQIRIAGPTECFWMNDLNLDMRFSFRQVSCPKTGHQGEEQCKSMDANAVLRLRPRHAFSGALRRDFIATLRRTDASETSV